jgi:3-phenylpropionate/cinnamic acid dioxygenase small subunit
MEFPTITFTVETSSGTLFERVFRLPAGSAFIEPEDNTEHTVALDPAPRDDWNDVYAKTDQATFNWSIEGESSSGIEKPVKKSWP